MAISMVAGLLLFYKAPAFQKSSKTTFLDIHHIGGLPFYRTDANLLEEKAYGYPARSRK